MTKYNQNYTSFFVSDLLHKAGGEGSDAALNFGRLEGPLFERVTYLREVAYLREVSAFAECNEINILFLFLSIGEAQAISVSSSNTTSLLIHWGHLKPQFLPDAVDGYQIITISFSGEITKVNVCILANEIEISGLEIFSKYCMTVRALTGEGYGSQSDEVCAFTAEDGKNV